MSKYKRVQEELGAACGLGYHGSNCYTQTVYATVVYVCPCECHREDIDDEGDE